MKYSLIYLLHVNIKVVTIYMQNCSYHRYYIFTCMYKSINRYLLYR